jgi:hypothetical protein
MRSRWSTAVLATSLVLVSACEPADPRRSVAEQFIDRLFVVIDQAAARELATGLAVEKLDEEIRLRGDAEIDESTRQPRVNYSFLEGRGGLGDEASSLVYELYVAPDGADSFSRRLILTMRRAGDAWRVSNYSLESPPAG